MSTRSILVAGHSHIAALGVPLQSNGYELRQLRDGPVAAFGLAGGWPREDTDYWSTIAARSVGRTVAIFWRGNQHFHHFLIMPNSGFDFVLDSEPDLPVDPTRPIVPELAVVEFMRMDMSDLDPIIEGIGAAGGQVVLCGTPPPKAQADFVREKILREPYFNLVAEGLGLDLATVELSPPLLLYKMWAVMQNMLGEVAARHGAAFLPVPGRLRSADGFLDTDYYAPDATHANRAYGEAMLDEIAHLASSRMDNLAEP